jgi:hypothetical protein
VSPGAGSLACCQMQNTLCPTLSHVGNEGREGLGREIGSEWAFKEQGQTKEMHRGKARVKQRSQKPSTQDHGNVKGLHLYPALMDGLGARGSPHG